jgi:hypothetical protein
MYSQWDITVREIGGGIWCLTSLALAIALLVYAVRRVLEERTYSPVTLTALAFAEFCFGSAIRGFLTWRQFMAAGNGSDPSQWIATWPWLGTSVILNIGGAAAAIWLLSPSRWRVSFTAGTVLAAILVPLALFYMA